LKLLLDGQCANASEISWFGAASSQQRLHLSRMCEAEFAGAQKNSAVARAEELGDAASVQALEGQIVELAPPVLEHAQIRTSHTTSTRNRSPYLVLTTTATARCMQASLDRHNLGAVHCILACRCYPRSVAQGGCQCSCIVGIIIA
jgi:hypothetical protein